MKTKGDRKELINLFNQASIGIKTLFLVLSLYFREIILQEQLLVAIFVLKLNPLILLTQI